MCIDFVYRFLMWLASCSMCFLALRDRFSQRVTRCNVSAANSQSLHKAKPFQLMAKPFLKMKTDTSSWRWRWLHVAICDETNLTMTLRDRFHQKLHRVTSGFPLSSFRSYLTFDLKNNYQLSSTRANQTNHLTKSQPNEQRKNNPLSYCSVQVKLKRLKSILGLLYTK